MGGSTIWDNRSVLIASTGSVLGYVLSPVASAALAVVVTSRVDSARSQVRAGRTIRLMLRHVLGVGPGHQPVDWLQVSEPEYETVSRELLALSDKAFEIDSAAGLILRDAAQRANDLGRLAREARSFHEQFDERFDAGERGSDLRQTARGVMRYRDLALAAAKQLYEYLDQADCRLAGAYPWWFLTAQGRSVPPAPFAQVAAYLEPLLEDLAGKIMTTPPSSVEREVGRLSGLDGMTVRPIGDHEIDRESRLSLLDRVSRA